MPSVQPTVIALAVADLHLGDSVPVARSAEGDWEQVQIRSLKQLCKYQLRYDCPVLIAGDLFDKPSVQPWCVNMALRHLPQKCYAIPGNHDLKNHNYADIRLTSFWTLVEGGRLTLVEPGRPKEIEGAYPIRLHGFPCGVPVKPLSQPHDMFVEVALVHDYIWSGETTGYQGAPDDKFVGVFGKVTVGYDVVLVGDNHMSFLVADILNCGCFQRRKADEKNLTPCVGLLYSDGSIKRKKLDTSEDRWIDNVADAETLVGTNCSDFIRELDALGDAALDYAAAVKRRLANGVSKEVKEVVLRCLEGKRDRP
jgi:hypothetical protein